MALWCECLYLIGGQSGLIFYGHLENVLVGLDVGFVVCHLEVGYHSARLWVHGPYFQHTLADQKTNQSSECKPPCHQRQPLAGAVDSSSDDEDKDKASNEGNGNAVNSPAAVDGGSGVSNVFDQDNNKNNQNSALVDDNSSEGGTSKTLSFGRLCPNTFPRDCFSWRRILGAFALGKSTGESAQ